jgi:PAS domain S-box-containing protein
MAGAGRTEAAEALFAGGGDIASRCRAIDWRATSLGPVDCWPESLCSVIRTCLGAPAIPMAIWIGPERIVLYNDGYVPLLGSARHPWALAQPARKVWPELWQQLGPMLARVIEHGESIQCDDQHFWLEQGEREDAFYTCSFAPIHDARDQIVGAFSILYPAARSVERDPVFGDQGLQDIAARKQAEEALRASEALARQRLVELETIYETAPIGLCVFDEDLRWIRLNRVIAEINGRPIADHIGRTPSEIVPDVGGQAEEALRTILRTGARLDFEMRGTTAAQPGVERFWSEHWVPMMDDDGRVVGISVAAEEITERKRAAEALAASEERYRTLAENAPEAIARLDREMRFTYINEYGARLFGLRPGDVIGSTFAEIVRDPALAAFWHRQFDEVTASGQHRTVEGEFESPVFGHQFLSVLLVPERSAPFSMLGIARDITPLKQVEDALRKSEAALREADRHRNEFLAWLSHELRNPMNVIRVNLMVMEQAGLESEHARRALPRITRQVAVIGRLLDDLLDVTRISKGKVRLQPEHVVLGELVRSIGEDHREAFDSGGIHFEVLVPDAPIGAHVDPARMSQVVGNLLQNAAKFTPAAGHVSLSLIRAADGQSIIEVRDDGAGIRQELLGRVFEPLVQDERMIAKSQGGLGLGLALVKGLVELHGGTVSAASDGPGRGAVFTVRLPPSPTAVRPA